MKISVVIPVYKSSESLIEIFNQTDNFFSEQGIDYELIFVNDSPTFEPTVQTLKELKQKSKNVKVLQNRKNIGQQLSLLVGLYHSKGDYVITIDDDLQHPIEEFSKLIDEIIRTESDAIFAVPKYSDKKHSIWRNFGSYLINTIDIVFLKKPKGLVKSSFRIIKRDIVDLMIRNYSATPGISSLIVEMTHNIKNIEVKHKQRKYGKSNYNLFKLISLTLNNVINYSSLPLQILGTIGGIIFAFSIIFIMIILIRRLFFSLTFPGWASVVILVTFFGGINMFAIGLIGEYLIRIIKQQHKPNLGDLYIER
jgi:glycosyltransferase involved in cell wall biosynthesis